MNWTYLGLAVAFAIAGIAVAIAALAHIRITNAQSEIRALRKIVEALAVAGSLRFGKEYVKVLDLERVIRGMGYRQGQRGWVKGRAEAIEEAAQAIEEMDSPGGPFMDGENCAAAIRALATKPPT